MLEVLVIRDSRSLSVLKIAKHNMSVRVDS